MADELFESSLRDQQRSRQFAERNKRIAGLKQRPASVSEILDSGREGRLFTSSVSREGVGEITRAINPDLSVDATEVEAGRTFAVQENIREVQREAARPRPVYMLPEDDEDPRAYESLDVKFPTTESFSRFAEENNLSAEDIEKISRVALAQRAARAQVAELDALIPTWRQDIEALVDWMKRTQGLTDAALRHWMRAPNAREFATWHEQWRRAEYQADAIRAKKTGHLSDVGEQISHLVSDAPAPTMARQKPDEYAAGMEDLRATLRPGEIEPGERGVSIAAAAQVFAKAFDLGLPADNAGGEDAEERSLL